jgi:monoamine oxidase
MAGEGGNQRIPEAMAKGLKTEIQFDRAVIGIRAREDGAEVVTYDGTVYRAKRVISTMPFTALRHVRIDPVTEGAQADAINNLGYTQAFQVHYVPVRKYWEEDGLPPSMWTDGKPGRFMALRNDPARPEEVTSVLAYVNGQDAAFMDKLEPRLAAEYILHEVAKMRPSTKGALKPVKIWSWQRNVFGGGPYAAWQPGQITRLARELGKPWKTLHIAGEHTAISNRGMEGAMESGERAALEVAALL